MLLIIWLTGGEAPRQWVATIDPFSNPTSHWPGSQQKQESWDPEHHPGIKGSLPSSFKWSSVFISQSRASLTDGIRMLTSRAITSSATGTKEQGLWVRGPLQRLDHSVLEPRPPLPKSLFLGFPWGDNGIRTYSHLLPPQTNYNYMLAWHHHCMSIEIARSKPPKEASFIMSLNLTLECPDYRISFKYLISLILYIRWLLLSVAKK